MNTTGLTNVSTVIHSASKSILSLSNSSIFNIFCTNCSSAVIFVTSATAYFNNITVYNCSAADSTVLLLNQTILVTVSNSNFT